MPKNETSPVESRSSASFIKNISFSNNPVFIRMLAISPVLAITISLKNGLFFSLLMTIVLLVLFAVKALCYDKIPHYLRDALMFLAAGIIVTPVAMLARRFFPNVTDSLGIYLPLIAINALAFVKTEKPVAEPVLFRRIGRELLNVLGSCVGFSVVVILVSAIREAIGNGTLYERVLPGLSNAKFGFILLPPGAFILLAFLFAFAQMQFIRRRKAAAVYEAAAARAAAVAQKVAAAQENAPSEEDAASAETVVSEETAVSDENSISEEELSAKETGTDDEDRPSDEGSALEGSGQEPDGEEDKA